MNPILWPSCVCPPALAQRIPELLEREGYSVRAREPSPLANGRKLAFFYIVADGPRRLAAIGIKHHARDETIVRFHPLRAGFRLTGYFSREKFAFAVIECLVRNGANKVDPHDDAKLRWLAESGSPGQARAARKLLQALAREKQRQRI